VTPSDHPNPDATSPTGPPARRDARPSTTTTTTTSEHDAGLLAAARDGDDAAFAALIERHDPALRRLAHHLLDGEGTEAALIDAYVKAYRAIGRSHAEALPWLTRITYLACLDRLRRREQRRRGGPGRLPARERASAAEHRLPPMPPDQQAVLVLVDRLRFDEHVVAETLAVPTTTVAGLLVRGRRALGRSGTGAPATVVTEPPLPSPEFWTRLGRQLLSERTSPAAPVPSLPKVGRSHAHDRAVFPVAPERRELRGDRTRPVDPAPEAVAELADGARRRRVRDRGQLRQLILKGAAVLIVLAMTGAGLVALIRMASTATSPVRENSMAEISRRSTAAMAELDAFAATVTRTVVEPQGRRVDTFRLVRTRAGSFAILGTEEAPSVAYDAATDTLRRTSPAAGNGAVSTQEIGLAAGPPDPSGFDPRLPDAELALAYRTFAGVTDAAAVAGSVAGVDAWILTGGLPTEERTSGIDQVTLVVDRAHLAPLGVTYAARGRLVRSLRFSSVSIDGLTPRTFTVGAGTAPSSADRGFRSVGLSAAASAIGRAPLRPTFLPAGYELAGVTVRTEAKTVALRYQRGFERIVVTTRSSPVGRGAIWPDPFERPEPVAAGTVVIDGGPFRTTTAQRVATVGALPSLWGSDGTIAFTVAGDLSADHLVRVAESLRA